MAQELGAKKILIVDDDRASRVVMRSMLRGLDQPCQIIEAIGGEQALRMIETLRPDIVLLEIIMRDLDGVSVCDTVKRNFRTRHTKILFVTVRRDERMIRAGLLAGGDDYIIKPFTREQFLRAIKRLMAV